MRSQLHRKTEGYVNMSKYGDCYVAVPFTCAATGLGCVEGALLRGWSAGGSGKTAGAGEAGTACGLPPSILRSRVFTCGCGLKRCGTVLTVPGSEDLVLLLYLNVSYSDCFGIYVPYPVRRTLYCCCTERTVL